MTPPPEAEVAWLSAALEELRAFLASPDAFRPLHLPSPDMGEDLSLGRLLLAVDDLKAREGSLTGARRADWDRCRARWEAERGARPAGIEAKARAELPHRLNVWTAYLQDLEQEHAETAAYPIEVRHRVIIERLLKLTEAGAAQARLSQADSTLRTIFQRGDFVWPAELRETYPEKSFWFLYGRPSPS